MIEKYGVEFQALTDKFKAKMQDLANDIRNFGKEAEEETTVMPKFVDTGYQKQIDYVKSQMQDIRDLLDRADAGEEIGKDTMKLEAEYETLSYKLEDLIEKQKEFNGELEETNETSSGMSINLGNMFDKSISKIKRFTYYLLGARSVFSLFMKYQSIYYQYNEGMQYQAELSRNAIALSLAPAFEFLGNMVAYASIAFAKFIELLTGVNVLSKVSTKGIRDYNKSLKETQTLVSGIDEITNLTLPTGTGLASQYKALDDFQKKIAEVQKWFDDNPWIGKIAQGLHDVFDFVTAHWDIFKYVFGAVALGGIMLKIGVGLSGVASAIGTTGSIGALSGVGTGLAGLTSLLTYLGTLGIMYLGLKIASSYADEKTQQLIEWIIGKQKESTESEANKEVKTLMSEIQKAIKELGTLSSDSQDYKDKVNEIKEKWGKVVDTMENNDTILDDNIDAMTQLKLLFEDTFDDTYTAKVELKLPKSEMSTWDKFLQNFYYSLGSATRSIFPEISKYFTIKAASTGRKYAKGLDYVPYDEYPALLHKGEAVVPAKYNPTIHSMGNEYTNSLLEELVIATREQNNRAIELNIDGQKFANATYGLYDDARNRQNYVEGVVR